MSEIRRMLLEFETEDVGRQARNDPRARKALVNAFKDASETVRERALIAALEVGDPNLVLDALNSLEDDETDVRIAAAQTVAWYRQPRTIPALLKGLKDTNTWVRSHCAAGLSRLLNGPIWARVKQEDVNVFLDDFPGMEETEVRGLMNRIGMSSKAIDDYLRWRSAHFDIEIDTSAVSAELEGKPIILDETRMPEEARTIPSRGKAIPADVEEILAEVPPELRATLPEEDLRRLTPETARELVDSLKSSFPVSEEKKPKEEAVPKKIVKVRKVKKVKRVKKGPSREELLAKIPEQVKASLPADTLDKLSTDELEALVSTSEDRSPESVESDAEEREQDKQFKELADKYGEEKARVLVKIPPDVLVGLPEDQINTMDASALKELLDAFTRD